MGVDQLAAIEGLIDELDATELATALRLREKLLAKTMRPLREFDAIGLYQLTKATSTKTFLEKAAGLSAGDAGAAVAMARKLGKDAGDRSGLRGWRAGVDQRQVRAM